VHLTVVEEREGCQDNVFAYRQSAKFRGLQSFPFANGDNRESLMDGRWRQLFRTRPSQHLPSLLRTVRESDDAFAANRDLPSSQNQPGIYRFAPERYRDLPRVIDIECEGLKHA
jgi:hypothetical protein